jgi:phosphate-selective porin OprO/OprP
VIPGLGVLFGLVALSATIPQTARAETPMSPGPDSTIVQTVPEGEDETSPPRRRLVKWNEYDGPVTTVRFGFGFLVDTASYIQDEDSKKQVHPETDVGLRDFRLLLRGRFKTERLLAWQLGYMYDGADKSWRFRQTGLTIGVPELAGRLFVGRTKEGYSMIKVMVGYHGWTIERSTALDAFIPILADGLKWMGYHPKQKLYYSLGWFNDYLSEDEKFAIYDNQVVSRVVWQPILSEEGARVLHVGIMGRVSEPDGGKLQVRSRPESYLAPYYLDTGKITSSQANGVGVEAFYRTGPWLFGTEYNWESVDANEGGKPTFHGGEVVASRMLTLGTRPYSAPGAYFEAVSPTRSVLEGGPGCIEGVLRFSYSDFEQGPYHGGKFWRITPGVNWYLTDVLRLEGAYGYGELDRFDLTGGTHFFQARIQTAL